MADYERILRNTPATLSNTFYVDESPLAPEAVTVTATTLGGDVILDAVAATEVEAESGTFTVALPAQANLNFMVIDWSADLGDDGTASRQSFVEIVGGFYFELSELRVYDRSLTSTTTYPTSRLKEAREDVEVEFERLTGRAFVPRFGREVLSGEYTRTLTLSSPEVFAITKLTVDGEDWMSYVDSGVVRRDQDDQYLIRITEGHFPEGVGNIVIEYEYGRQFVPRDIKQVAKKRAKYNLTSGTGRTVDERATVMNIPDFGNFVLSTPGVRGAMTGLPAVDLVLDQWSMDGSSGGGVTIA